MLLFFNQMHIKWQIHLRMGINAIHLVLFFVLKCVNVGFYIWHPITVQPNAQAQSCGNGPAISFTLRSFSFFISFTLRIMRLVCKKDLILMFIMSQLRSAFFFVFALFDQASTFKHKLRRNILALFIVTTSLHALFR